MGYVLLVYSRAAYAEYPLPCQEQGEWVLSLEQTRFALPDELQLAIWYQNGLPYFLPGPYSLRSRDGRREFPLPVEAGQLYFLSPSFGGQFILAVRDAGADRLPALRAYLLDGETSIGSLPENCLIYSGFHAVSGTHAVVLPDAEGHRLENRSSNGAYVNGRRVSGAWLLAPGDRIHIFGLDILYRGRCIVLDTGTPGLQIHESLAARETALPSGGLEDETVWEGPPDSEAETVFEGAPDCMEETVFEGAPEDETVFETVGEGETVFEGAGEDETVFERVGGDETVFEGAGEDETVFEGAPDSGDETVWEGNRG